MKNKFPAAKEYRPRYVISCEVKGEWLIHPEAFGSIKEAREYAAGWTPWEASSVVVLKMEATTVSPLPLRKKYV